MCFIGIQVLGSLAVPPQGGSRHPQIHSISPSVSRGGSPRISTRGYQRLGNVKSIELTSDELPSAEHFQDAQLIEYSDRDLQQKGGRTGGTNNYLTQDRRGVVSGGELVDVLSVCCHLKSIQIIY